MFHLAPQIQKGAARSSSTTHFAGRVEIPVSLPQAQQLSPGCPSLPQLLGTWLYVAGAAQFPQHRLEMLLIDRAFLRLEPGASENELLISHYVAV